MGRKKTREECVADITKENIKKFIIDNDNLMKEWDFTKNNNLKLYPENLTQHSNKYVWWLCEKKHSWQDTVNHRTSGRNCPFCSNHRVLVGYNDLASLNPTLSQEWNYKRNGDLKPNDVMPFSNKKVWWICPNGHEYESYVAARSQGHGCRYCQGQIDKDNDKYNVKLHKLHKNIDLIDRYTNVDDNLNFICHKCNSVFVSTPHLIMRSGCPICSHHRIGPSPEYKNSIFASKFNELFEYYGLTEEQRKAIMPHSGKKISMKCPICGNRKNISPDAILRRGFGCRKCSDGISYPNKFMYSIFKQLKIDFIPEYIDNWTDGRKYDLYNKTISLIVENHGLQHYEEITRGRTLSDEQENDKYKYKLAVKNNIQHYVVIDCRYSEIDYIKNSIMHSELPLLLNFTESDIDWIQCGKDAIKNRIKEAANLWNRGKSMTQIAVELYTTRKTALEYLKKAQKLGLCNYSKEESYTRMGRNNLGVNHPRYGKTKKIVRLKDLKQYTCAQDTAHDNNIGLSTVYKRCKAHKDFMHYDEWLAEQENLKGEN